MTKENTERNKALREYHKNNPNATLNDIAKIYGISKVRVWQIVNSVKCERKYSWWQRMIKRIRN